MVDPNGEFPWLLAGLFLAGGGIDLGFQMGIEGRSFDEVNWLRVGVAGGTTAIGGVFGKALHSASIGGRTAFAAGAIADFGVGVAADRYLLGDSWGTAVASNMIGFGVGEFVGYAGKGIARGIANSGFAQSAGRMAVNAGRTARNVAVDAAYAPLGMILGVGGGGFRAPRVGGGTMPSRLPVSDVRFTQAEGGRYGVRTDTLEIYSIEENMQWLRDNPELDLPPIEVFRKTSDMNDWGPLTRNGFTGDPSNLVNNLVYSVDNRRLETYMRAGRETIPVNWISRNIVERQRWKFQTQNGGESISIFDNYNSTVRRLKRLKNK